MEHIKTIDELITEKFEFKKWKYYIIGISIYAAIASYPKFREVLGLKNKIDATTMYKIIDDIESVPTPNQKVLIDKIKNSMIEEASANNKLNVSQRIKVIEAIQSIKVVMTSNKNVNLISDSEVGAVACYMNYMDITDRTRKRVILISEDRLKSNTLSLTHEMYHLIDDVLGNDIANYSEIAEIVGLLDKDIVMKNPVGIKKIEAKLDFFIEKSLERPRKKETKSDISKSKKPPLTEEEANKMKKTIINSLKEFIYSNKDYMTLPSEIYVRFHGLKRWLVKEKFIKDVNDPITKKIIVDIFSNSDILANLQNDEIDYFELLFMLNLDITNDVQSEEDIKTLKKANSIVSNFSDYKKDDNIS